MPTKNETIVLLHGILRSKMDMLALEKKFSKAGYDCINILYPSREKTLEEIAEFVDTQIKSRVAYAPDKPLNFVTHSMGGLVTRYYIATYKPENLGKVVMLSPPNTGSEFADFLSENKYLAPLFKNIFGPASAQLTTQYKHIDTEITYPLGIIAGSASLNPLAPWILEGEHDGIVPVERTKIDGMTDHITLSANHSFMMFEPKIINQALYFLENEKFDHTGL
ncbi:MAG: alpha/beta fold hydrolase [Alphaproteobacteria bacterium]|nr:alpha/beta fold hydrolase [Alphaproteobacteria bacterium]